MSNHDALSCLNSLRSQLGVKRKHLFHLTAFCALPCSTFNVKMASSYHKTVSTAASTLFSWAAAGLAATSNSDAENKFHCIFPYMWQINNLLSVSDWNYTPVVRSLRSSCGAGWLDGRFIVENNRWYACCFTTEVKHFFYGITDIFQNTQAICALLSYIKLLQSWFMGFFLHVYHKHQIDPEYMSYDCLYWVHTTRSRALIVNYGHNDMERQICNKALLQHLHDINCLRYDLEEKRRAKQLMNHGWKWINKSSNKQSQ